MEKIELEITALSHSITQSQSYAVVLGEVNGNRRLPVVIGAAEAQAIAVAMEKMTPSRPLTHDLMKNICSELNVELLEVVVNNLMDGVFYAKLICQQGGKTYEIDSRTSDALALSVRFGCPIYTFEFILDKAGIVLESPVEKGGTPPPKLANPTQDASSLASFDLTKLNEMLESAINNEDYEKAAKIRDEISKRTS